MPSKINRILITLIILISSVFISQSISVGQSPIINTYMPLISHNPSGWIGPYSGTIVALAIDPTNPQNAYAGSFGAGVYKSMDGGYNWLPASQGLGNLYIYSLAINPAQPSIVYAGTYKNQIYKSMDGGISWVWSGSGMQDQAIVYSIAIDGADPATIYATTRGVSSNGNAPWNGVVYKSTDAGASWKAVLKDVGGQDFQDWAYSIMVNPNLPYQVVIATHEHGPYRSNDYGEDWFSIHNGILDDSGRSIVISPLAPYKKTMFYGVWHVGSVYKSEDGGDSWNPSNYNLLDQHVYTIALDPQNIENVYLATFTSGIIKSSDGGATWQNSGLPLDDIYSLVISKNFPNHLVAGTNGDGVFISENAGTNWLRRSSGIQNAMVTSTVFSTISSSTIYSSLFGAGVYQSNNQGQSWNELNTGLSDLLVHQLVMDPGHPGIIYALTDVGGLFRNDLNSNNGWVFSGNGLPLTNITQPAYPADHPFATLDMQETFANEPVATTINLAYLTSLLKMVYAPSNSLLAYIGTAGSGMYRSADGGQSWQKTGLTSISIADLAVDIANPDLVYAISYDINAYSYQGVLRKSTNGGTTWDPPDASMNFYSLAASPSEAVVLYAGTNQGIYYNKPGTWTLLGLSDKTVTAIALDPAQPGLIYAGTTNGAYYSLDSGNTWSLVNDNLLGQTIEAITIDSTSHNHVYFSTKDHGIFLMLIQF